MCRAGLHDFTDPVNVGTYRRAAGGITRYCKPCNNRRARNRKRRIRQAAHAVRRPPCRSALDILQAVADGESPAETAERLGITRDGVHVCLGRARRRYGVASTAAAAAVGIVLGDIRPVKGQPLPPRTSTTRDHARSLLRLIRGERGLLRPGGKKYERMMDDLYAWHEVHAVSVLMAARIITAGDIRAIQKEAA